MNTARRARVDEVVGAMRLTAPEGLESRPVDRRGSHRRITIVGSLGVAPKERWSTAPRRRDAFELLRPRWQAPPFAPTALRCSGRSRRPSCSRAVPSRRRQYCRHDSGGRCPPWIKVKDAKGNPIEVHHTAVWRCIAAADDARRCSSSTIRSVHAS